MLKAGDVVEKRYRVLSLLDEGGMSRVYMVYDLRLDNRWILKELSFPWDDAEAKKLEQHFIEEARICARLSHPGVARVVDYFTSGGVHYLVEEYAEGDTLRKLIDAGKISWEKTSIIALKILDVLQYVHDQKIVYRDLKPENVIIQTGNNIKIIDFGIAREFKKGKDKDTVIMGTPGFAAPEQYGTAQTDFRTDIYSLGALMHNMITGEDPRKHPFIFDSPSALGIKIPAGIEAIIMKALSLKTDARFATAREMRLELKKAIKETRNPQPAPQVKPPQAVKPSLDQVPVPKPIKVSKITVKRGVEPDNKAKMIQTITSVIYFLLLFMTFALMLELGFKAVHILAYFVVAGVVVFIIFKIWTPKNNERRPGKH
ncbi:MAG: serine/threonine protein kinase [Firmicutes bacterium]|nr:serine/threonine protein kinase [Bacillota bacterium]